LGYSAGTVAGWAKNFQAINLASATIERIQEQFIAFARKIKVDKKKD
jgi:hypothetical protein